MARHISRALAALIVSGTALVSAESRPQPEFASIQQKSSAKQDSHRDNRESRLWWKNRRDMAEIGLTAEQSAQIDRIFRAEIEKMKPMRLLVMELERGVDATSRANTTDIAAYTRQVEYVERKRAELNTARTVMLYRMRQVLNAEQNVKFQAMNDRRDAERKKQDSERRR